VKEEKKNDIHTKLPGTLMKKGSGEDRTNHFHSTKLREREREGYNIGNSPNQTQSPELYITKNLFELIKQTRNPSTTMIANHHQASKTAPNPRKEKE